MQRSQEISLVHLHDWVLSEVVFLLSLIFILQRQRGQWTNVPAHLAWYKVTLSVVEGLLRLEEHVEVDFVGILRQSVAQHGCCSHSDTLVLVELEQFEKDCFTLLATGTEHTRDELPVDVAFFDECDKDGQAASLPDKLTKSIEHGQVLDALYLTATCIVELREDAWGQDDALHSTNLQQVAQDKGLEPVVVFGRELDQVFKAFISELQESSHTVDLHRRHCRLAH